MAPIGFAVGTALGFWHRNDMFEHFLLSKGKTPSKREEVVHILKYGGMTGAAFVTTPIPFFLILSGLTLREERKSRQDALFPRGYVDPYTIYGGKDPW
jgi:hypothetical protein